MGRILIIPDKRSVSTSMKESNSSFLCPSNCVITDRWHKGDENGQTQYEYATLKVVDENGQIQSGTITVEDVKWHESIKESSKSFKAPSNRVIVGRKHSGDENGQTQYATAIVKFNGEATIVMEGSSTLIDKESSGTWFKTDSKSVLIGRYHNHDENGYTTYYTGTIVVLPDGDITERTARGYTGMVKVETSVVGRWPEGDRYVAGRKIADVYQLTYDIPVSSDRFFATESPNCGYVSNPVRQSGALWITKRNYWNDPKITDKVTLTTYCVQLDKGAWYPCKPEDVEWKYIAVQ